MKMTVTDYVDGPFGEDGRPIPQTIELSAEASAVIEAAQEAFTEQQRNPKPVPDEWVRQGMRVYVCDGALIAAASAYSARQRYERHMLFGSPRLSESRMTIDEWFRHMQEGCKCPQPSDGPFFAGPGGVHGWFCGACGDTRQWG